MTTLESVYERLPRSLRSGAATAYGTLRYYQRFGGRAKQYRREFDARDRYTAEQWDAWQRARLAQVLQWGWETPHYRRAWAEEGVEAGDLQTLTPADLERLPTLQKEVLRKDAVSVCRGGQIPKGAGTYHSSGSTGTPVTTYITNEDFRRLFALRASRYRSYAGVDYSMPRASFSGRRVEPEAESDGPFHVYNFVERQVYFSPYHLGPPTVAKYVEALHKHRPRWITGYAGAIHMLARFAEEAGLEVPPFDAVVTAAEPVTDEARRDIPRVFGAKVTEEYGLIENNVFALECPEGSLHVSPDCGYIEIVDDDGRRVADGEVGEIVGTAFQREAHILVRYRTGDLGTWATGGCSCGHDTPILAAIEGRVDDVLILPDGRRVGRLSHVPKNLPGVVATQFVQDRPDHLLVRVLCEGQLRDDVVAEIEKRLHDRIGKQIDVTVRKVDELERTKRGKVRGVIRRVETTV